MRHDHSASAIIAFAGTARPPKMRCRSWAGRKTAAAVAILGPLAFSACGQQVDAFWNSAASGNWIDPTLWTTNPFAPDNGNQPGVTYRAFINAGGSPYTVSLLDDIAVDQLTLGSSSATLSHGAGVLTAPVVNLSAGTYSLNGGTLKDATVNLSGGTFAIPYNTANKLDNVTINGSLSLGFTYATVEHGLTLNGGIALTGDGTLGFIGDAQTVDAGTFTGGRLSIGGGSTVTFGPATQVHVGSTTTTIGFKTENEPEGDNQFINQGLVTASGADRYLNIMPNLFTNEGTVEALDGATVAAGVTQNGLETQWTNNGILRVNNGTLSLGGRFSFGPQASIERTGGKISLAGVWNNSGTLDVNSTTGSINMDGGAINGGVVNLLDGQGLIFDTGAFTGAGTGGLYGLTLNGDLELSDKDAALGIRDGLTLNGTVTVTGDGARIYLQNDQTIHGGTFVFDTTSGTVPSMGAGENTTVTLDPDVVIRGRRGGFGGLQGSTVVNQGLISADIAGQPLSASGWVFENQGIIEAKNGAQMGIGANQHFYNSGLIRVADGTLSIGNHFRQTGGTIEQTGGLIVLTGDLDNSGLSMTLDKTTDQWMLDHGIISGGDLNITSDARLLPKSNSTGELNGVTVNGQLVLDNGGGMGFRNGLELNGSIILDGNRSIESSSDQTFSGDGEIVMAGNDLNGGNVKQELLLRPGGTLTIAPEFTIRGGAQVNRVWLGRAQGGGATLVNQGLISAEVPDQGIAIKALTFINEGVLEATNASTVEITEAYWSNTGTIRATGGGFVYLGGTFSTPGLGTIDGADGFVGITGQLDNTDSTLVVDSQFGTLNLMNGHIRGGTIETTGDGRILAKNGFSVLDGVGVQGDVEVGEFGHIDFVNSSSVSGVVHMTEGNAELRFNGDQTFDGAISFEGQSGARNIYGINNSLLTLGPSAYVHGGRGTILTTDFSSVDNQGLISADVPDQKITIYLKRFSNEGTVEAINGGILDLIPPDSPDRMELTNSGILSVGAGSRFLFEGDYIQTLDGALRLAIGGDAQSGRFGQAMLAGQEEIDGALEVVLADGYMPRLGDTYRLIGWDQRSGEFSSLHLPNLDVGEVWNTSKLYDNGVISVGVPAPGTAAVLAGLGAFWRRRRAERGSEARR